MSAHGKAPPPDDDSDLFREALKGVAPLPDPGRVVHAPRSVNPFPYQTWVDEREVLAESLTDGAPWDVEYGGETSFIRPGINRQVIRRLKRGHWVIQAHLDLHGLNRMEARLQVAAFLNACVSAGLRCVRVVHGKGLGSRNKEPVLKSKVRLWLAQREEVLAYAPARPVDGGDGALMVLLRGSKRED